MKKQFLTIIAVLVSFLFTSCEQSKILPIGSGEIPQKTEISVNGPKELENTNDFDPITKESTPQIAQKPIASFKFEE